MRMAQSNHHPSGVDLEPFDQGGPDEVPVLRALPPTRIKRGKRERWSLRCRAKIHHGDAQRPVDAFSCIVLRRQPVAGMNPGWRSNIASGHAELCLRRWRNLIGQRPA